ERAMNGLQGYSRRRGPLSGPPDRLPEHQEEHGADRGRDQFAPKVRYNVNAELAEQKSAEQRADEAHDKVTNESTQRIGDLGGQPAGNQADQNPGQHAHPNLPSVRDRYLSRASPGTINKPQKLRLNMSAPNPKFVHAFASGHYRV